MPADGSVGPQNVDVVSQEDRTAYPNLFLSVLGPSLPSVLLMTNYDDGSVERQGENKADLIIKTI